MVGAGWVDGGQAGVLGAAALLGYLIGILAGSGIGRRRGVPGTLDLGMGLVVVALLACAWNLGFWWFLLWRTLAGVGGGLLMALAGPATQASVPAARRGAAGGIVIAGVGLGIATGAVAVPVLLTGGLPTTWVGLGVLVLLLWAFARPARFVLPTPRGTMAVSDLELGLAGASPVLSGVSFTVEPGECLGIVGPSGSGKSTLLRALAGAVTPRAGTIRLDGAELAVWGPAQRSRHCGYLPQGVHLLPGTIAENIARLVPGDDAGVVNAAQRAFCHELIAGLPRGYDTVVGEGGELLPPGQRQRVALARALYGQPRVVILDEPNASLDGEGEQALTAALRAMRTAGITVILAAHKPSLMSLCDRLLVLGKGTAEEPAPTAEVLVRLGVRPQIRAVGTGSGKKEAHQ
jgi:ABC-type multidrug transport system fused ATPase/permease subunit